MVQTILPKTTTGPQTQPACRHTDLVACLLVLRHSNWLLRTDVEPPFAIEKKQARFSRKHKDSLVNGSRALAV